MKINFYSLFFLCKVLVFDIEIQVGPTTKKDRHILSDIGDRFWQGQESFIFQFQYLQLQLQLVDGLVFLFFPRHICTLLMCPLNSFVD